MGKKVTFVGPQNKNKTELKKHAATIHCSNTLSLLQRKISNALLYHAYKELQLKEEHEITVKQLCRLIGYQGNNHAAIKDALRGLITTIIEWNLVNETTGAENWTASSIIASVSLEGPLCYYAYSPRMKQLLHSPSMFGKIDLVIQSRFRSSYGLALYENCIRYRGLPQTKWFEMDLFKKLMGVPNGIYDIFRDFKRRVLDKAINEVNMYSDLLIQSEFIKEGRKVTKVRFKLKDRAKKTRLGSEHLSTTVLLQTDLKAKLHQFQLTEIQIEQLFKDYSEKYLAEKMELVEASKMFQAGKIKNLPGFLISAIKNDYQVQKDLEQLTEIKAKKLPLDQEVELNEVKWLIEAVRKDYKQYRERAIHQAIDSLSPVEKSLFLDEFKLHAESAINTVLQLQSRTYHRDNILESPQIRALLRQYAQQELDILWIVSLEEFVAQADEKKVAAWRKLKSYNPDHPLLKLQDELIKGV